MDSVIEMTMEQAEQEIKLLKNIFQSVRIVKKGDLTADDSASSLALREKKQKTKLVYSDEKIYEVIARYVEIDGEPCVMELARAVDTELVIEQNLDEEAVKNKTSFYDLLYVDAVSGAYNRRYYEECIAKKKMTGGVAMIDMDNFKISNDIYGHDMGDKALSHAAAVILKLLRKEDCLIRYGGDEFLLVMPDASEEFFEQKLKEIRNMISIEPIPECRKLLISVSIGGAMARDQEVKDMISRADRVMYQAKKKKNTVMTEWRFNIRDTEQTQNYLEEEELERQKLLIVDDSEMNRAILGEILKDDYDVIEAADGKECLEILEEKRDEISLVLLDFVMPNMNGLEVLGYMNTRKWMDELPVIMISSEDSIQTIRRVYDMGVTDYISRPFDARVVHRRVSNTIRLYAKQRRLTSILSEQVREKEESRRILVEILGQIVEFRNAESGMHVRNINILTRLLVNRLVQVTDRYDISNLDQDLIVLGSSLHDIGKIGIDEKLLNKPGKLTKQEFEIMKTHTLIGAEILDNLVLYQDVPLVKTAYEICRWHHERYDGKGYPDGLVGEEIPISAQIVSLADVYDALVSKRAYKASFSHEKAMQMIMDGECGQFNPILLQCLKDIENEVQLRVI